MTAGAANGAGGGIWRAIGPGILFAGAAVGVSHLVQSTRAGAAYGLSLLGVVILANVLKYPAFRFGPQYAAATGNSLLEGYRQRGRWALVLYGVLTLGTMFTVQAAVVLVTAALLKSLGGSVFASLSLIQVSSLLVGVCAVILAFGQYAWLDRIGKAVVSLLALCTLAATLCVLPEIDWGSAWSAGGTEGLETADWLFMAALIGWMPSAIDVAVWQSLWTVARAKDTGHQPSLRQSMIDFHAGYIGTGFLAICFLVLGAGVMFGSGAELDLRATAFPSQFVQLYVVTLGEWSRPLIATAAILVMFSTTLTVVDGFPRALQALVVAWRSRDESEGEPSDRGRRTVYWVALGVLALGSLLLLAYAVSSLRALIDVATVLSFLTAPVLSWLNHRSVLGAEVPERARPKPWLIWYSGLGIAVQGAFALFYLAIRFG